MTTSIARQKMSFALWGMTHRNNQKVNSSSYRKLRLEIKETLKEIRTGTKASEELRQWFRDNRKGEKNGMYGKRGIDCPHTGKKRPDQSERMTGTSNPFFNKKHSDDVMTILREPKAQVSCIHCKSIIGGIANLTRWHQKCFSTHYKD